MPIPGVLTVLVIDPGFFDEFDSLTKIKKAFYLTQLSAIKKFAQSKNVKQNLMHPDEINAVNSKYGISKEALEYIVTPERKEFASFEKTILRNIKLAHYNSFKVGRAVILTSKETKPEYDRALGTTDIPKNVEIEFGDGALRLIRESFRSVETALSK